MTVSEQSLDLIFAALGDPTRRAIVTRLSHQEQRLSDLAEPFDMSQTAVSKHVRVLAESGLVTVEKRGRTRYCKLNPPVVDTASQWLEEHRAMWQQNFDNLGRYFAEIDVRPGQDSRRSGKK